MKVYSINEFKYTTSLNRNYNVSLHFRGAKDEVISEGFKEVVGDLLPVYKGLRALDKFSDGDNKGATKQAVGVVDNIVLQPAKQAVASIVAAKGATIGTMICPGIGTAIGATLGYFGTLIGWGKARNSIVDSIID